MEITHRKCFVKTKCSFVCTALLLWGELDTLTPHLNNLNISALKFSPQYFRRVKTVKMKLCTDSNPRVVIIRDEKI